MKVNFESLYEHIGFLFHALVRANGDLSTVQLLKLTDVIERVWKPMSGGDTGLHLHLVDCIHEGVRYAIQNGMSSENAFSSFSTYYQIHPLPFSASLKEKIMTSISEIVKEFPGSMPGELNMSDLQQLMSTKQVVL